MKELGIALLSGALAAGLFAIPQSVLKVDRRRYVLACVVFVVPGGILFGLGSTNSGSSTSGTVPSTISPRNAGGRKGSQQPAVFFEFIVDTSSRMRARFGPSDKLSIAKSWVLTEHFQLLPPGSLTALRTFGSGPGQDCSQWTQRKIPFRSLADNAQHFASEVPLLQPDRAKAPLSRAVVQATGDVLTSGLPVRKIVLLVVTGGYDTCWADFFRSAVLTQAQQLHIALDTYIIGALTSGSLEERGRLGEFIDALKAHGFKATFISADNGASFLKVLREVGKVAAAP